MKKNRRRQRRKRGRGIYILPNLITTASLFAGFYSLIATFTGRFIVAAYAILVAVVCDGLDGRVARATGTTSSFGVEYDSLVDLVSFGVAPGFLIYAWALSPYGRVGFLAAFLYVVCGALRLARFNVQVGSVEKGRFNGLPIPAAATLVASTVLFLTYTGYTGKVRNLAVVASIYVVAFLMVSNVKYNSFKELEPFRRRPFHTLVAIVLLVILLLAQPEVMIFAFTVLYILSGPAELAWRRLSEGKREQGEREKEIEGEREKWE
ncbi:MAG: CDP-diacylglycerol--serine O-phosphatidyltransferase, partial [Deltaproteobacteria bacterium]